MNSKEDLIKFPGSDPSLYANIGNYHNFVYGNTFSGVTDVWIRVDNDSRVVFKLGMLLEFSFVKCVCRVLCF